MAAPRWLSLEFALHSAVRPFAPARLSSRAPQVVARAFAALFSHMRQLTRRLSPPGAASALPGVRPGLLPGSHADRSDPQWRAFRDALPLLCAVALASSALTRLVRARAPSALLPFHVAFGLAYAAYAFGGKAVLLLLLATASFLLSKAVAGRRIGPPLVWAANCGALLAVQLRGGRPLAGLLPWGAALDGWRGAARWDTSFNLAVLRLISFGMDCHWAAAPPAVQLAPGTDALRALAEAPLPQAGYSYPLFLAYLLFPPLALAGPILSCNAFAHQLRPASCPAAAAAAAAAAETGGAALFRAAMRLLFVLATLEWSTHALHANAVASSGAWRSLGLPPAGLGAVGYFTLAFMWLKFTAIWRFFRLWAAGCGLAAPENMTRCFSNNYDVAGFWRGWHASFNRWLVRYAFVPLGGSHERLSPPRRAANLALVFLFVALWHDLAQPRLLGWAALCSLALAPELALKRWAARSRAVQAAAQGEAYRHACAAAAALNIGALLTANTVGFVLGLEGAAEFGRRLLAPDRDGGAFAASALLAFFCAAQLMFEQRAAEARWRARAKPAAA